MANEAKMEALAKIRAAEAGCDKVHKAWCAAHEALKSNVSINGYGVYHDNGDPLRRSLREAQSQIAIALGALDAIKWPNDDDYDDAE